MTRFAHISDTHGSIRKLGGIEDDAEIIVFSGDILPNLPRPIHADSQRVHQQSWLRGHREDFLRAIKDRPVVCQDGNHDFTRLAEMLREFGVDAHQVTPEGVTVAGIKFAGFRHVPFLYGEWAGETHDFDEVLDRTFASNPDILVTHAPPSGLLDISGNGHEYGIRGLTRALQWCPHNIRMHLYGHAHRSGPKVVREMDITFSNAATGMNHITLG
jgi:Icc-related predicted phosphoesterase